MTGGHLHAGLLLLRLGLGTLLLARGYQHLFSGGLEQTAAHWQALGLPYPLLFSPLLSLLELLGGPLIMLGLGTRPVAALSALAAAATLILGRWDAWASLAAGAGSLPEGAAMLAAAPVEGWWLLLTASLCLAVSGPGRFSVDARFPQPGAEARRSPAPPASSTPKSRAPKPGKKSGASKRD